MRSPSLFGAIAALILHALIPRALGTEYSLSVLSPEDKGSRPLSESHSSNAIVEDVNFEVPDFVNSISGVRFRVLHGSTELFVGNLDDLKSGELTFGVNDSQLILGTNFLEVEFFVPPSPEVIARSHMVIELGEKKGMLRRLTSGRRGWALGASGAAAAGLAVLGLRRYLNQIPVHQYDIASSIPRSSSVVVPAKSVLPSPPSVGVVPSPSAISQEIEMKPIEAAPSTQVPQKLPSAAKKLDSAGLFKKPFRRSGSWLQAPTAGVGFGALKQSVRNVHLDTRGKFAVSAVGAAVLGKLVSSVARTVSNLLEVRRRNSLSPPERIRDDFQTLMARIRLILSRLR
jgi:hypothetical protein